MLHSLLEREKERGEVGRSERIFQKIFKPGASPCKVLQQEMLQQVQ